MGLLLYQNEACLVINKLPGESSEFPALPEAVKGKVFPVHRLDTPVSGCLLLAKNQKTAAFLSAAFAGPEAVCQKNDGQARVEKIYWAIIEKPRGGITIPSEATFVHWISEDGKANKSFAFTVAGPGHISQRSFQRKKAIMRYRLIGQGDNYLFLEIDLVTGRHHQIRAQLAAEGLHTKGDLKYGAKRSEKQGGIRLHAFSLAFPDPLHSDETIKVETLPPVMDSLWEAFRSSS